ncbi:MAG: ribonuclease E/G [Pararhodobacter sp.]
MKGSVIVLGAIAGRDLAARMLDGQLDDLALSPPGLGPGAILRGVVGRPVKGLGGVFVDLPDGARGFLRQPKGLAPGQRVLVQIAGLAEPGKALPLSLRLMFKSRHAIITPDAPGRNISRQIADEDLRAALEGVAAQGMEGADPALGLILRSACAEVDPRVVAEDVQQMRALTEAVLADTAGPPELLLDAPGPHELAWRDWPTPDVLDDAADALDQHGVLAQIDGLLRSEVALPGGAGMVIEPTRALVAVDVNTGADTSPAAGLKACLAAARELPRQLRLRGLGGQVVVDFAPCPKKDRHVLEQALRKAFRSEGASAITLAGWTPLGNFELQRRRDRMPLADWMQS